MAGQPERQMRRLPWYGWVSLGTLLAGELGLLLGVFPVRVLFYCIAWWSYIVLADAWVWKRRGDSLLRDRPRELLVLAFWSIAVWNLFEVLNFRLRNWFYVNVPTDFAYGAVFTFFAYATVIPGIFETYDLLRAYGVADRVRMRPWRIRPSGLVLSVAVGLVMLVTPLLWPRHAFPWVWGFVVFLLDPICYRSRRLSSPFPSPGYPLDAGAGGSGRTGSVLGQFERGDPRPFLRLLLAGLICGGLWEFWNFWAYTKWIYTVPFFEDLKWFEMPPLGFLGFPPFAVECYVLINLLNLFRRGRGWEEPAQVGPGAPPRAAIIAVLAATLFNIAVYVGIDRLTVQTYMPTLAEIEGVRVDLAENLSRAGVDRPPALLKRTATPGQLSALAQEVGAAEEELRAVRGASELVDLEGLGAAHYNGLRRLGISRVQELASQNPEVLVTRWQALAGGKRPTLPQVKAWVRAARLRIRPFDGSGAR